MLSVEKVATLLPLDVRQRFPGCEDAFARRYLVALSRASRRPGEFHLDNAKILLQGETYPTNASANAEKQFALRHGFDISEDDICRHAVQHCQWQLQVRLGTYRVDISPGRGLDPYTPIPEEIVAFCLKRVKTTFVRLMMVETQRLENGRPFSDQEQFFLSLNMIPNGDIFDGSWPGNMPIALPDSYITPIAKQKSNKALRCHLAKNYPAQLRTFDMLSQDFEGCNYSYPGP
jgi:hypothetical protein